MDSATSEQMSIGARFLDKERGELKRGWLSSPVVAFHFPEKMAMREDEL